MPPQRKLHTKNGLLLAFVLVSSLFLVLTPIRSAVGDSGITIEDPPWYPGSVQWYLEPYVTLNVSAAQGVDTVILSYTTNRTDTWQNITMTPVPGHAIPNGSAYEAQLPSQPQFTLLTFVVIANDTLGNYAVKNNTAICYVEYIPEFPVPSFILVTILTMTAAVVLTYAFHRNRLPKRSTRAISQTGL
jgi:hypothetical protein